YYTINKKIYSIDDLVALLAAPNLESAHSRMRDREEKYGSERAVVHELQIYYFYINFLQISFGGNVFCLDDGVTLHVLLCVNTLNIFSLLLYFLIHDRKRNIQKTPETPSSIGFTIRLPSQPSYLLIPLSFLIGLNYLKHVHARWLNNLAAEVDHNQMKIITFATMDYFRDAGLRLSDLLVKIIFYSAYIFLSHIFLNYMTPAHTVIKDLSQIFIHLLGQGAIPSGKIFLDIF
ncbi:hypothetical protein ACJX0J_009199, partial [Zea mays]